MNWDYVAGYFDGEGSAVTQVRLRGGTAHHSISFWNTHRMSLEAIQEFIGAGTIRTRTVARGKPCHGLHISDATSLERVGNEMLSRCIIKQDALQKLLDSLIHVRPCPQWGSLRDAGTEEITRLYHDEGLNQQQIADRYGVTPSAVKNFLKRNGIPRRSRGEAQRLANRNSPAWQDRNRKISQARQREWAELTPEQRREKARPMFEGRHKKN